MKAASTLLTRFSAAPPTTSRPEAANFPSQLYEFTADPPPFQPPASYPAPPKDMWYKIPDQPTLPREARPNPIFPWEQREQAKPSRFFAEDISPPQTTARRASPDKSEAQGSTPSLKLNDDEPPTIDSGPRNAWDEHPGIGNYIRQLSQWQRLRGKVQVLSQVSHMSQSPNTDVVQDPMGAANTSGQGTGEGPSGERRGSLILTDFPSAVDRPSLPVTPAPIRRTMFWGEERNAQGQLPGAEGVPDQVDWVCPRCSFSLPVEHLLQHLDNVLLQRQTPITSP